MTRDDFLITVSIATEYGRASITVEQASEKLKAHDTEQRQVIAEQEQQINTLREQRDNFLRSAAEWRGLDADHVCSECNGAGMTTYANTSTYHHGIGGQAMTRGVCDKCWGSGDKQRPWKSWQAIEHQAQEIARWTATCREKDRQIEELKTDLEDRWTDEHGVTWTRPTSWAYAQICRVREQQAQDIDRLRRMADKNSLLAQQGEVMRRQQSTIRTLRDALATIVNRKFAKPPYLDEYQHVLSYAQRVLEETKP